MTMRGRGPRIILTRMVEVIMKVIRHAELQIATLILAAKAKKVKGMFNILARSKKEKNSVYWDYGSM